MSCLILISGTKLLSVSLNFHQNINETLENLLRPTAAIKETFLLSPELFPLDSPPRTRSKDKSRRTRGKRNKFPLPRQSRAGDSYLQVRDASIFTGRGDVLEGISLILTGLDFLLFQPLASDNFI